jgi:hypothetical protein
MKLTVTLCIPSLHAVIPLGVFAKLRKPTVSFVTSVRSYVCPPAWNNTASIGQILIKFGIWDFSATLSKKFKFYQNLARITGTLYEDVFAFMTLSRWIVLRMRNVLGNHCRENENTHFTFNNFYRKSHRLWDNVEKYARDRGATNDVTIWRIHIAWWRIKATCTYAHAHAHVLDTHTYARTRTHTRTDQ